MRGSSRRAADVALYAFFGGGSPRTSSHRSPLMRRLRAALSLAALWAVTWGAFATCLGVGYLARGPRGLGLPRAGAPWRDNAQAFAQLFGDTALFGWWSGLCFAALLVGLVRRQPLAALSARRTALWGALAGAGWLLVSVAGGLLRTSQGHIPGDTPVALLTNAVLGAIAALLTLAVARRAAPPVTGRATSIPDSTDVAALDGGLTPSSAVVGVESAVRAS